MNKLSLDLHDLHVETFSVHPAAAEPRGTVRGHVETWTLELPWSHCPVETADSCNVECYSAGGPATCAHTICDCDLAETELVC